MNKRFSIFALALSLALLLPIGALGKAGADELESVSLMHVVGTLIVEPDGSVSSVQVDSKLDAPMHDAVERTMHGLHFNPVLINGVPQQVGSAWELSLAAHKTSADKYSVNVDGVHFSAVKGATVLHADGERGTYDITAVDLAPPIYPFDAQAKGAMGRVLLAIKFDRDGKFMDAAVVSSLLYEAREGRAPGGRRALASFEKAALDAARSWRVKITPGNDGELADGYTAMTPVVFTLSSIDLDADGRWLSVQRTPLRPIPWKDKDAREVDDVGHSSGLASLGGGGIELAQSARGTPVL